MPENGALLFVSFWFSMFFFAMAIANSILCFECIAAFDIFLATLLCILCSHELARKLTLRLLEDNKKHKK